MRQRIECYATGNDTNWHMATVFGATKVTCPHGPADGVRALDFNEAFIEAGRFCAAQ